MGKQKFSRLKWVLNTGCDGDPFNSSVLNNFKDYLETQDGLDTNKETIAILPKYVRSFESGFIYEVIVSSTSVKNAFKVFDVSLCNWLTPQDKIIHPQFTPAKVRVQLVGAKREEVSKITGMEYTTNIDHTYTYPFGMNATGTQTYAEVALKIEESVKGQNSKNKVSFEVETWRSLQ